MTEALQQFHEIVSDLRSSDHVVLLLVALLILGFFIAWNTSPGARWSRGWRPPRSSLRPARSISACRMSSSSRWSWARS